jgi:hypothetical protein
MKVVPPPGGDYGHMYLIKRDVSLNPDGTYNNVYSPDDRIIRGASGFGTAGMGAVEERLGGSLDNYSAGETPSSRHSVDITDLVGGAGKWSDMATYAFAIDHQYDYELPGGQHLANSNAVTFTVLARAGLDVRTLNTSGTTGGGPKYVDSFFPLGAAGGDTTTATLLASSAVTSAENLDPEMDVTILGRNTISDFFSDTARNETIFGDQNPFSTGTDIVNFSQFESVDLKLQKINSGINTAVQISSQNTGTDKLYSIEEIHLTNGADTVRVTSELKDMPKLVVDGGSQLTGQRDILDFSALTGGVTLKKSRRLRDYV